MNTHLKTGMALLLISSFLFISCNDEKEDLTEGVNKSGSVESAVTVEHLDSTHDVLITKHIVWNNNAVYNTIVYRDTLPALGDHYATAENEDGDTKGVTVKKDYEIFITVK